MAQPLLQGGLSTATGRKITSNFAEARVIVSSEANSLSPPKFPPDRMYFQLVQCVVTSTLRMCRRCGAVTGRGYSHQTDHIYTTDDHRRVYCRGAETRIVLPVHTFDLGNTEGRPYL